MNEKIDLTKVLKDCPKGMELDSELFNGVVTFNGIINDEQYPIEIKIDDKYKEFLDKHGRFIDRQYYNCAIFPKGKTTWEGFQRPFIDGDIVYNRLQDTIGIVMYDEDNCPYKICELSKNGVLWYNKDSSIAIVEKDYRFATEEEKQKLFQVIKDNGYKWNSETMTLEKLIVPKFKVGDSIQSKNDSNHKFTITNIDNGEFYCGCEKNGYGKIFDYMVPVKNQDNWKLVVKHKFKVGDKIRHKSHIIKENIITEIKDTHYILDDELALPFINQDNYELLPNKFDPKTLKPFDKVLIRDNDTEFWRPQFFSFYQETTEYPYKCMSSRYKQCILYNEETKHLLGTNKQAPEFYIY